MEGGVWGQNPFMGGLLDWQWATTNAEISQVISDIPPATKVNSANGDLHTFSLGMESFVEKAPI